MTICARCETLPRWPTGDARMYLWPPLGHTYAKLVNGLRALELKPETAPDQGSIAVALPHGRIDAMFRQMDSWLKSNERHDTNVLFLPEGQEPSIADFGRVSSLEVLTRQWEGSWLVDILEADRLTSHFQPIVHAQDLSRIFAQECLLRANDKAGNPVSPARMFDIAHASNLLFQLDAAARRTAVRTAAENGIDQNIFINFTPTSIYDPAFCLRSTIETIERYQMRRDQVVFEVVETERIDDHGHLAETLRFYRENGFRVALDDLGAGYSSLNLLPSLKPDFVKIDRELIDNVDRDTVKAAIVSRLVSLAHELGIEVIAEGIERAEELEWLRGQSVDYVQGYLIARPDKKPLSKIG